MAKISKRLLGYHNKAIELLKKDKLDFNEREFVYENYHEGAGKMNNLISAHFTPDSIARDMTLCVRHDNFVDLCAGIGMLSYKLVRQFEMSRLHGDKQPLGICVEKCTEYYKVGKKLLPQLHWINGDVFDPGVIDEIKSLMQGKKFSIISNPPYGNQVKIDTKELLHYPGRTFEYKAMELGAVLGANDGCFLIPQQSANFRLTGQHEDGVCHERYKTAEYNKFVKHTGLEMTPNMGIDTSIFDEDKDWKDVTIITEIAIIEYDELDYESKYTKEVKVIKLDPVEPVQVQDPEINENGQISMF